MSAHKNDFNPDPTDRIKENQETIIEIMRDFSVSLGLIARTEVSVDGAILMRQIAAQSLCKASSLADSLDVVVKNLEVKANA